MIMHNPGINAGVNKFVSKIELQPLILLQVFG